MAQILRNRLVKVALEWEDYLGVGPAITPVVSALDAPIRVGMTDDQYCTDGNVELPFHEEMTSSGRGIDIKSPLIGQAAREVLRLAW
jgi:hypothetical protein